MGVYIKGMKMPTNCNKCILSIKEGNKFGWCYAVAPRLPIDRAMKLNGRPTWCPLVEVLPHGDLIDRDALSNDGWTLHKEVMVMGGFAIHELPLKNPTIPVIIEAEE